MVELVGKVIHRPLDSVPDEQMTLDELTEKLGFMKKYKFWGIERDCRSFSEVMQVWKKHELYKHFAPTWEQFATEHIDKPVEWVEHILNGVSMLDKSKPITAEDAKRASVAALALSRKPDDLEEKPGRPKKTTSYYDYHHNKLTHACGTDASYLTARIARDYPGIHAKMLAGEYKSVRSAAIDAGIVRDKKYKKIFETDSPERIRSKLIELFGEEIISKLQED